MPAGTQLSVQSSLDVSVTLEIHLSLNMTTVLTVLRSPDVGARVVKF